MRQPRLAIGFAKVLPLDYVGIGCYNGHVGVFPGCGHPFAVSAHGSALWVIKEPGQTGKSGYGEGHVMSVYTEKYDNLLTEFSKGKAMVLSSSENGRVSSRMMSIVFFDGFFYFQTDKTLRKYHQLISNPQVALCADNIQIEGICEEIGHPMDNVMFCNVYQKCFNGSFNRYSSLRNERLFAVKPTHVERWLYVGGVPFIETYDIEKQQYDLIAYQGE